MKGGRQNTFSFQRTSSSLQQKDVCHIFDTGWSDNDGISNKREKVFEQWEAKVRIFMFEKRSKGTVKVLLNPQQ